MAEKNKKRKQEDSNIREAFQHEYVGADTLALLFGVKTKLIYNNRYTTMFDRISSIKGGHGKMYNFHEAAKLAYPTLSDYEIALLRLEINDKLRDKWDKNVSVA